MNGIFTSDWHIDFNNRMADTEDRINEVINKTIEMKCDFFCFIGDAYKNFKPLPVEQEVFHRAIMRLLKEEIQVIIVVGNHDMPNSDEQVHCFTELKTLQIGRDGIVEGIKEQLIVVDKPSMVDTAGGGVVVCMPYLPKGVVGERSYGEAYFDEVDKLIKKSPNTKTSKEVVFASHVLMNGARIGASDYVVSSDQAISPASLVALHKLVGAHSYFFGDVHAAQVLMERPFMAYCGSLERIDFGEINDTKGFYHVSMLGGELKETFIGVEATEFIELTIDLGTDNPMKEIREHFVQGDECIYKDAIVKVSISGTEDQAVKVDEDKIREILTGYEIKKIASLIVNIKSQERIRNEKVNETVDPVQALKEWVVMQNLGEEKTKQIMKIGKKLLGEGPEK